MDRPDGIVTLEIPAHTLTPTANVGEYWIARLTLAEANTLLVSLANQVNEISAGWAQRSNPAPTIGGTHGT